MCGPQQVVVIFWALRLACFVYRRHGKGCGICAYSSHRTVIFARQHAAHPVSFPTLRPEETQALWSHTTRRRYDGDMLWWSTDMVVCHPSRRRACELAPCGGCIRGCQTNLFPGNFLGSLLYCRYLVGYKRRVVIAGETMVTPTKTLTLRR